MLLSIIMPVYNEAATIAQIVDKVMQVPLHIQLVIVNDASKDATAQILSEIQLVYPTITIVHHPINRGKAAAIKTAIPLCTGDIITIQDGDLETDPMDLVRLVAPIVTGEASVVYGSRYLNAEEKRLYLSYQLGGRLLSYAVNILYGQHITDEPACYKVFKVEILKSITLHYDRFEFCPEVTAKVSKLGYNIKELPMSYYPRSFTQGKKVHWTDGFKALWVLIKYRFVD